MSKEFVEKLSESGNQEDTKNDLIFTKGNVKPGS